MRSWKYILLTTILTTCFACSSGEDWEIFIYQHMYFKAGQKYQLVINDGGYEKTKKFKTDYSSDKYLRLTSYKTDIDSLKVYFKLDQLDTVFRIPSDYTTRLVVGSTAEGEILIRTDKDHSSWVYP